MGLFDVLRYPISDRPTLAELEALPDYIVMEWMRRIRWNLGAGSDALFHSVTVRYDSFIDHPRIVVLRKIIKDIE